MKRIALFAGSFDPYTNGHHDIVRKAAALFDEVIVMVAVNTQKTRLFDAEATCRGIAETVAREGLDNIRAVVYRGLVADYCAQNGIRYYVRGLRSSADYDYEENIAQINRLINPELETIYLRADEPGVSSTLVRELLAFGKPIDAFVPFQAPGA